MSPVIVMAVSSLVCASLIPVVTQAGFPSQSEDADTRGRGNSKLELVAERNSDNDVGGRVSSHFGEISFGHGLTENLDLSISQTYRLDESGGDTPGLANSAIGIKLRYHQRGTVAHAIRCKWTIPADGGPGAGTIAINHATSKGTRNGAIHLDAGYRHEPGSGEQREHRWHLSATAERRINRELVFLADIGIDSRESRSDRSDPVAGTLGLSWEFATGNKLETGIRVGLNDVATDVLFLAGISRVFHSR